MTTSPTRRSEHEPKTWQMALWICAVTGVALYTLASVLNVQVENRFGLERREPWTNTRLTGFPDAPPPMKLVDAYPEIKIERLIALDRMPGTPLILAVDHRSEWGGPSHIVQFADLAASNATQPFLERDEIIYGLAFHPKFQENRFVYVGCNGHSKALDAIATKVIRFRVEGDGPYRCDPASEKVIIEWKSNGHNGGDVVFGSDGMLYITAGDGTSDSDIDRNGQNLKTLNGSMLRIDVDHAEGDQPYSIPADNPFLDIPEARAEIWAFGLRNPWRVAYDAESDQLWVGNNGQDLWESVYLIERGKNYGWSIRESNHDFHVNQPQGPVEISDATFEHHHSEARSLTGGLVYRGKKHPELQGAFVYGDFSTGNIWAIRHDGQNVVWQRLIARSRLQVIGFGEDTAGELLVADHQGGIYRLEANDATATSDFPKRLSETGLFADTAQHKVLPGLVSYSVNSPLWSDGAVKDRWMAIPDGETISFTEKGSWDFPNGTVLVKSFSMPKPTGQDATNAPCRRIETRLMVKQSGEWLGYSYRWRDDQCDADLVAAEGSDEVFYLDQSIEAAERALGQVTSTDALLDNQCEMMQTTSNRVQSSTGAEGSLPEENSADKQGFKWHYPSRSECMVCHSRAAKFVLGLSTEQMNRKHDYSVGRTDGRGTRASQIESLAFIGLFGATKPTKPSKELDALPEPLADHGSLEARVRAYLHSNCAVCHVEAGGGNSKIALDFFTERDKMNLIDAVPIHSKFGLANPKLVAPGDPENSVLLHRISKRGEGQMPPLATHLVDDEAVKLIRQWISSLDSETDSPQVELTSTGSSE